VTVLAGRDKQISKTDSDASLHKEMEDAFPRYQLTELSDLTRHYSRTNPGYQTVQRLEQVDRGLKLARLEYEHSSRRLDSGSTPVTTPRFLESKSNLLYFRHNVVVSQVPTISATPLEGINTSVKAESAKTTVDNRLSEKLPEPAPSEVSIRWNNYIADIWADAVLSNVPFFEEGEVVEVAPGDVPKVGLALKQRGFKGTLYVVEPERQALKKLIWLYKELLPETTIVPVNKTLDQAIYGLPRSVNAILSNHPLDDMILGKALSERSFNELFENHYHKGPDDTRALWQNLEATPDTLREIKMEVGSEWRALVEHTNPQVLAMSQYESYFFKKHNLPEPDANAFDVLQDLKRHLGETPDPISQKLQSLGSDPSRWLVALRRHRADGK
jgi:hypothetical protein